MSIKKVTVEEAMQSIVDAFGCTKQIDSALQGHLDNVMVFVGGEDVTDDYIKSDSADETSDDETKG